MLIISTLPGPGDLPRGCEVTIAPLAEKTVDLRDGK
jgi:hypothetical protein